MRLNKTAAHHFLKVYQLVFSEGPVMLVDTIHIYTNKHTNNITMIPYTSTQISTPITLL